MTTPHTDPDLIKISEIFLIPSSFLVAALGAADTNAHRAMVSLLGLIISFAWGACSREAYIEQFFSTKTIPKLRTRMLAWLATIFIVGWFLSFIFHLMLWGRPLGSA